MSLRRRLLVALLGLAAVGLLVLDVVSYAALRSYLSDRLDQQVEAAAPLVGRALIDKSATGSPLPPGLLPSALEDGAGEGDPPGTELPPGTYGELRDPEGKVVTRVLFAYGDEEVTRPDLPAEVPVGGNPFDPAPPITVDSNGSSYRVSGVTLPDGAGTIVVAVSTSEINSTLDRLLLIELIVTAVVLAALALVARWIIALGLRPLERMETTARAIAAGDLSRRVEDTDERTEVGRLGVAFNEMLSQIEEAFAEREASENRLRTFLADASHELRTPVASIRGYAEIFRTGAARDPEKLATAMSRIEAEAERVGVLVDDLLSLARLDEVREHRRDPVELSALVADAVEDVRTGAPDREVVLDLPDDSPTLVGDADQLHRVVVNLVQNAVRHTPASAPIEVTLDARDDEVELRVRDHGRGLELGSEERVFERFWRRGEWRRDGAGAGLGLAIVKAIVTAHGGDVTAANATEGGALFTVRLPREPAETPPF